MKHNSNNLRRMSGISMTSGAFTSSSILGGGGRKLVERGVLVFLIIAVVIAIFAPVGVLIEEFLNIEGGGGGSFNYKESCSNSTEERVSI